MRRALIAVALLCFAVAFASASVGPLNDPHGVYQSNHVLNRNFYPKSRFDSHNLHRIKPYCNKTVDWIVSNHPAIHNNIVYFSDWSGLVGAFDLSTPECKYLWTTFLPNQTGRHGIRTSTGSTGSGSRNTPAIIPRKNLMLLNDLSSGRTWGIRMTDGVIVWEAEVTDYLEDARLTADVTLSEDNEYAYVGVSSHELANPNCFGPKRECAFRGALVRLRVDDGKVMWRFQTAPGNITELKGYAGASVWGSGIPEYKGRVYFASGNTYRIPDEAVNCLYNTNGSRTLCVDPEHRSNSVICLDATTGALIWSHTFNLDVWTVACALGTPECDPKLEEGDVDFAQAPMIVRVQHRGKPRDVIAIGQKSGDVHMLNIDTGELIYTRKVGPHSFVGGVLFGHAADRNRIYFSNTNGFHINTTLIDGTTCSGGIVTAIEPHSGQFLWQWCAPNGQRTYGPITATGDLIWVGSMGVAPQSNLFALDAATGTPLWSATSPGSRFSSPAPYKKWFVVGSGYTSNGATQDNHLYVYHLSDCRDDDCYDD